MTEESLRLIVQGLNGAGVKYLVVGGLAVNAHGYVRNTKDIDLLLHFDTSNLLAGLKVLKDLGYQSKAPVPIEDFADPAKRASWIGEKHMLVFGLRSDLHRETDVDIFVNDPLGFDDAYARVYYQPLDNPKETEILGYESNEEGELTDNEGVVNVPFCSYEDLVKLKEQAGRPRDIDDLRRLRISRGEE